MLSKNLSIYLVFALFLAMSLSANSQGLGNLKPETYTIAGITVEGNIYSDAETIISLSGLRIGESINYPADTKIQKAVTNIWQRKQFSKVDIVIDRISQVGLFLIIKVDEFPRMNAIIIENNDKVDDIDIRKAVGKIRGDIISNYELYLIKSNIKKLYAEEGLTFAQIDLELQMTDTSNYANIIAYIEEGIEFKVASINFEGNENFSDSDLEDAFDETSTKAWWQFWKSAKFDPIKYEEDKKLLLNFFQSEGYIDAQILSDSIIYDEVKKRVYITVNVSEGPKVYVRDIKFKGNTIYTDEVLLRRLEFKPGDIYNVERFTMNLSGNESQTDASSLYMDNGYLQARLIPQLQRVPPDSVDIVINIFENDRFRVGKVHIVGNTKTKDKVIRRELYTRPGDFFDRSAIIRSVRALQVMQYFNPESLRPDIKPSESDNTSVDVIYKVDERSTDTFNASIGFAGSFGLTGALGFTFNNFSILEPLKGGGGQIFNLSWEFGQANRYRTFSLGITEPWLFDTPTTVGFNIFDTYYRYLDLNQSRTGIGINLGRRFKWPDDYWRGDFTTRYQLNNNRTASFYYRQGEYTELSIGQKISRISFNNMFFPSTGSKFTFGTDFAMGAVGLGETDYIKNEINFEMYNPISKIEGMDRLVFMIAAKVGYITGFKSDTTISPIELYRMGGNGLSGFSVVPLRGYPDNKIGSGRGSRVMSKYTAELRFAVSLDPMPIYLYGFAEAGNVWDNLRTTDPFDLKRSAGLGVQLMVAPIGVIGFSYGYGFDPLGVNEEKSGWRFLFHLGQ
ncbi:MAG: outer membrane protein assembly factor BamA [Candidatus Kapabacteria bacterium]|nr:outer membrane protein assembly factor BamA [Candidatus Kapabacteria bacterium]